MRRTIFRASKEWREQEAVIAWATYHVRQESRLALLYHIPNGEKRDAVTAGKLEKMGVRPGVPDLFLPVCMRRYYEEGVSLRWEQFYGLYLEMKRLGHRGSLSAEQQWWKVQLMAQGYHVCVCAGWVEAVQHLCWYLRREDLLKDLER